MPKKGLRKYTVCLVYLIISTVFVSYGICKGGEWLTHTAIILSAFMGANSIENYRSDNETPIGEE